MAQYAIIKQKTKAQSAKNYVSRIQADDASLYFYFGNPVSWAAVPGGSFNDTTPPQPTDTLKTEKQIWDGIIGLKKIGNGDVALGFKRVDWVSGQHYDMYRDDYDGSTVTGVSLVNAQTKPLNLANSTSLVVVESSGTYRVYRCIDNRDTATGYALASTVKPTSILSSIQTTSDGYKWKYMGQLSSNDASEFLTANHCPIPSTVSTTTANGEVVSVVLLSRGNGYLTAPTVTIKGDGTGLVLGTPVLVGGGVAYIPIVNSGTGYTYVELSISGGTPTTPAVARAILAPTGGFCSDFTKEVEANYMIARVNNINTDNYFAARGNAPVSYATDGVLGLTYRTVGLIENPVETGTLLTNFTEYRCNLMTGSISYGDKLTSPTSGLSNPIATVVGVRKDSSYVATILTINAATAVNNTTHAINKIGHALVTGDAVSYSNGGGTSIGGLTNGSTYYVVKVDADNFKLSQSQADANNNIFISITTGIGASHTLTETVVKTYVSLAQTTEQLIEDNPLVAGSLLTTTTSSGSLYLGPFASFNGSSGSVVGVSSNIITINGHPFTTGDKVTYSNGGGTTIPSVLNALVSGGTFYVIRVTSNEIKLATSYTNALAGTAIDFTGLGSGSAHTITYTGTDSVDSPAVTKYSGNIIFTEYRNAVTRSTSKEKFRFVLEF